MKNIELILESSWILKYRADAVMPVSKVCQFLQNQYAQSVSVNKETYSYVELSLDEKKFPVSQLKTAVNFFLKSAYSDYSESYLELTEIGCEEEMPTASKAEELDTEISDEVLSDILSKSSEEVPESDGDKIEAILSEIDSMIAGDEFKKLAHEVATLAPTIKEAKTEKIFLKQRYLVSVNDGCCLDEYLALYSKLLVALDLKSDCKVVMRKLEPTKPNADDPRTVLLKDLRYEDDNSIICIDISDWMNQVNTLEFKEFLSSLLSSNGKAILMFRIPFVDKEVLSNIGKALNDMLFLRQLSFPPFTNEQIGKFADLELKKYGFSMDAKAWTGFFARIREESSDGRFYGMDTIVKVVEELLYAKQLDNAVNKRNSKVISKEDTDKLCNSAFAENLTGMEMLDRLVGTESIKKRVLEIISQIDLVRKNPAMGSPSLHMRFVGNPGTGKTTIARIIGKILKEKGILRIGEFHEHAGRDFCGRYIGETAPKTMNLCRAAYGSVLFIDEAYSLYREDNDRDYGKEALDTLIAEMENHRNDFVVIMAGYTDEMTRLMKGNAGLESRMPYIIEFPNFTKSQLYDIFVTMCKDKIDYDMDLLATAKQYFDGLDEDFINSKEFSNARFVRNLYERVCAKAAMRCQMDGSAKIVLTKEDFEQSVTDKEFLVKKKRARIGF